MFELREFVQRLVREADEGAGRRAQEERER
jgi:hypothetical protein